MPGAAPDDPPRLVDAHAGDGGAVPLPGAQRQVEPQVGGHGRVATRVGGADEIGEERRRLVDAADLEQQAAEVVARGHGARIVDAEALDVRGDQRALHRQRVVEAPQRRLRVRERLAGDADVADCAARARRPATASSAAAPAARPSDGCRQASRRARACSARARSCRRRRRARVASSTSRSRRSAWVEAPRSSSIDARRFSATMRNGSVGARARHAGSTADSRAAAVSACPVRASSAAR